MKRIRPGGRIVTAIAVPVMLMAGVACGGESVPTAAEDKAQAERIVLKASDIPGFTVDNEEDGDDGGFRACLKDNPTWSVRPNPRGADSDFTNDDAVYVSSGALLTAKVPEARKAFADVKAAMSSQCMRDEFKAAIVEDAPPGITVGDVATVPLSMPGLGDESTASRITVDITAGADRDKVYLDLAFMRRGRTVTGIMISEVGAPFAEAERIRLSSVLADRMDGKPGEQAPVPAPTTTSTKAPASTPTTRLTSTTAAAGSPSTTGAVTSRWTQYRDPSGVTFEHAPTWKIERVGEILVVFVDPVGAGPFRRNVNIMLQRTDPPVTLEQYTEAGIRELRQDKAVTVGQPMSTTLSGTAARRVTHSTTDDGGRQFLSVWTVRSGEVWLVTYTSDSGSRFDAAITDIERMLLSMKLPA